MDALLTALAAHRGFCLYRLAPLANGKTDKIPFDGVTGYNSNAQNPATWLLPAEALALAKEWAPVYPHGTGVGLVIYAGSQLAFIDLDGCIDEHGVVADYALEIIARFPAAVVEISASGRGLHIFFRYTGVMRPHKTKNKTWHIEAYTKERFAALTGNYLPGHEAGWIGTDHTQALDAFLAQYFPADGADFEGEWTDAPEAGWNFITDDAELIQWAMTLRDPRAMFGGKASFPALFTADADALGHFFPSSTGQSYDASSADQALANFFAWATGNHCDRVANLMERSALKRDKWQRDDYFRTTIAKACAGTKKWPTLRAAAASQAVAAAAAAAGEAQQGQAHVVVSGDAPQPVLGAPIPPAPMVPPVPTEAPAVPDAPQRSQTFFTHDQQKHFAGFVYVEDIFRIMDPQGQALEKKQFDAREPFAGRDFQMTVDGAKPGKSAWDAFISGLIEFPKVRGQYFEPREAPGAILMRDGSKYVNTWQPVEIDATPGDVQWFLDHVRKLLPVANDAHILLQFLKFMVQHKGEKAAWFPFIQGVEGNGKSFINDTMQYCLSERYTHTPRPNELAGRFNSAFYGKLFIRIEDIQLAEARHIWETLKPMVDGKRLEIEYKGVDKVTREVCFNIIATSNHKDGIPVTTNDRRVAPFFCAQQQLPDLVRDGMDTEYFTRLWDTAANGGWAAVLHYLSTDPIDPVYNPAEQAIRAPTTSSTFEAKATTLGPVEQEIIEAVEIGAEGFRGGWICSAAVDRLLRNSGKDKAISINKRRAMLAGLGYVPHPGLTDGRVAMPLPDGTKPRLYVKPGHPSFDVQDKALVRQLYLNVNGAPGLGQPA